MDWERAIKRNPRGHRAIDVNHSATACASAIIPRKKITTYIRVNVCRCVCVWVCEYGCVSECNGTVWACNKIHKNRKKVIRRIKRRTKGLWVNIDSMWVSARALMSKWNRVVFAYFDSGHTICTVLFIFNLFVVVVVVSFFLFLCVRCFASVFCLFFLLLSLCFGTKTIIT